MRAFFQRRFLLPLAAWLAVLLVAAGIFLWFLALPLEARYWGRRVPVLKQVPVPIRETAATVTGGRKMAFCGTEFEFPRADLNDGMTKPGVNSTTLFFDSGLVTIVKCEPPREFVEAVLSAAHLDRENLRRAFGDRAMESDYALTRLILETTPDAVSFFRQRRQGSAMALLTIKAISTPRADTGIFSIHSAEFDGFQYQDPQAGLSPIVINLFFEDRTMELDFLLKYKGAAARISQADINRVIQTLHKVGPYIPLKQADLAASH